MKQGWEKLPFEDSIVKVKYTTKIPSNDYLEQGLYPIVSQEEGLISGYWDNANDVFKISSPVVIFGDHTRILKYVDFDFVLGADGVKILQPIKSIDAKFFKLYLESCKIPSLGYSRHYKLLKELQVPVPPREEQERIVEELDCLSGVIEKKREQLNELDALAQSIFYQMFGDPITNEKGWEENIIGNLADFYNGVAHEGSISKDGQYDVINSKFISTQGEIRKHCDSQIFPLMKNDIVMVMSDVPNGKALAKCYLIETSSKYTLNQRICAFRNYNCFKPIFLYYYLNRHPYYLRFDDGNGQTNLRKNDVLNCPVYIPPLTLQQEFADKIEAIEKQKELIKQSITETEELFNSRMSYYFN